MQLAALCAFLFQATPIPGGGACLSTSLPGGVAGSAPEHELSPDGAWVVYRASQDDFFVQELYSVPTSLAAGPNRLCLPFVQGGNVANSGDFRISPDSSWVVYRADQATDEHFELYGVPIDGSAPARRISGNLPDGSDIDRSTRGMQVLISAHTDRAVYLVRSDAGVRMWSAPFDGSAPPASLSPTFATNRVLSGFHLSPDGTRAIYYGDLETPGQYELYSVPVDGSQAPVRLNQALPVDCDVRDGQFFDPLRFPISPDSTRVVFMADEVNERFHLFSASLDGSAPPIRLTPASMPGAVDDFRFAPGSARVVYSANQDLFSTIELFSVPSAGGAPVQLNAPLVQAGDVLEFRVSPDGQRVAYVADGDTNGVDELYGARVDGTGAVVKLNSALTAGALARFAAGGSITNDGTLVYLIGAPSQTPSLNAVPVDGSAPSRQVQSAFDYNGANLFAIPDGGAILSESGPHLRLVTLDGSAPDRTLYTQPGNDTIVFASLRATGPLAFFGLQHVVGNRAEVLRVSLTGSPSPTFIHPPLAIGPPRTDVDAFRLSPDGEWAVYTADQTLDDMRDLCSVRTDGSRPPVRLNPGLGPVSTSFLISADSAYVVFRSAGLRSAPIDGRTAPALLSVTATTHFLSPDGVHVIYRADEDGDGALEVRRSRVDGTGTPIVLLESANPVDGLSVSPDSSSVVFRQAAGSVHELYRVPADGSGSPTVLSGTMVAGGEVSPPNVGPFQISSDSQWVVYRADAVVDGVIELFAVRIDGSAAPVRLTPSIPFGGNIGASSWGDFRITPEGLTVVYRADQDVDERFEVYSVPIDGSALPVKLNGPLGPNQDVDAGIAPSFRISPSGDRVVYVADQAADQRFDFFSAPIDGSSAAVNLSTTIPGATIDAIRCEISPDGSRLVYSVFFEVFGPDLWHLFSRRLDGSAPSLQLDLVGGSFNDVSEYHVSADGSLVGFRASSFQQFVEDLYLVPIDGSGLPRKVNPPLPFGSDGLWGSLGFALAPDLSRVVYVAAQRFPTTDSLWVRFLAHQPRRH